jgi:hypothetical protein
MMGWRDCIKMHRDLTLSILTDEEEVDIEDYVFNFLLITEFVL